MFIAPVNDFVAVFLPTVYCTVHKLYCIHAGNKTGRKVLAKTIFKYNEKISYLTQENIQCNISLFTRKI